MFFKLEVNMFVFSFFLRKSRKYKNWAQITSKVFYPLEMLLNLDIEQILNV
jgi:hypothetical protein